MRSREALFIGTALGIGNFLALPSLFAQYDFRLVLFFHFLSLIVLAAPLLVGEIVWARWLRRNVFEAFSFLPKPFSWTPYISLVALVGITPLYVLELKTLLLWTLDLFKFSYEGQQYLEASQNNPLSWESLLALFFVVALTLPFVRVGRKQLTIFFLWTLRLVAILLGASLLLQPRSFWSIIYHALLSPSKTLVIQSQLILDVAALSLFTLSVGLGIHFLFTYWSSPLRQADRKLASYWNEPGRIHYLALKVIFLDFLLTIIATLFILPWLEPISSTFSGLSFEKIFFVWWPEFLRHQEGGLWILRFLSLSLMSLGLLSLLSLQQIGIHFFRHLLGMSHVRVALFFSFGLGVLSLVLNLSLFRMPFEVLILEFLLPFSSFLWCLSLARKFPEKHINLIMKRNATSDALNRLWRFSQLYLVPTFLLIYLFFRIYLRII
jgi:SNF family Na+-dependent transporter